MEKFLAPKGIKKSIFYLLKEGLQLMFLSSSLSWMNILGSLFLNIILNGIESFHSCIRFGSRMVCLRNFSLRRIAILTDRKL